MDATIMEKTVAAPFPTYPKQARLEWGHVNKFALFKNEELEKSVSSMRSKKAPDLDKIPSKMLKAV